MNPAGQMRGTRFTLDHIFEFLRVDESIGFH